MEIINDLHSPDILMAQEVENQDIYALTGPLDLTCLMQIAKIERYDLKDRNFTPSVPTVLRNRNDAEDGSIFAAIRQGDILVHHPYDSYDAIVEFIQSAAEDERV